MSIGILTSGGDAPGMNAAIRACFRALKRRHPDQEIVFFRDGFIGLSGRLETPWERDVSRYAVRDIIHQGGTVLGTGRVQALKLPEAHEEDFEERLAERDEYLRDILKNLGKLDVEALIVIGGDGSFRGASLIADHYREQLPGRSFRVIGIPATIDNDLHGTDFSIGYDTALNNIVDVIRKIRDTVSSHKRGIVLEVMGNTSGWLALQSAIAGGASTVAIPEIPESFDHDEILKSIVSGAAGDYRYFIMVVAEGVLKVAGEDWSHRLLDRLQGCGEITDELGHPMEVRINSIGHVVRGGRPSAFDNTLASRLGAAAARAVQEQELEASGPVFEDVMIGVQDGRLVTTPLWEVAQRSPRLVERRAELWELGEQLMLQPVQPF